MNWSKTWWLIVIILLAVSSVSGQHKIPKTYSEAVDSLINECDRMLLYNLKTKGVRSFSSTAYDALYTAITKAKSADATESAQFQAYTNLLRADSIFQASKNHHDKILFVGTGDIQKSLEKGNKIPANTGIGVMYERDFGNLSLGFSKIDMELSVNIASTVDSIIAKISSDKVLNKTDFGNSVLLPINSGQAGYFDLNVYFANKPHDEAKKDWFTPGIISGLNINFVASNRNWVRDTSSQSMTALAFKLGVFKEFIPFSQQRNYAIKLGFHLTMNSVQGDIGQSDALLEYFIGSNRRTYFGGEFFLGVRLRNIRAEIALPMVSKGNGEDIPGLTGTRLVTRIRFTGGFPISLN